MTEGNPRRTAARLPLADRDVVAPGDPLARCSLSASVGAWLAAAAAIAFWAWLLT